MDPEQLAISFRKSPKGMVITGVDGRILATNPAFCRSLGYTDAELRNSPGEMIVPPEDRRLRAAERARLFTDRAGDLPVPARYRHRDGHTVTMIESRTPLFGDQDKPLGLFALVDAMPDAAAAREALVPLYRPEAAGPAVPPGSAATADAAGCAAARGGDNEADHFFGRIFEVSGEAMFIADAETGVVINCNQRATELIQRPLAEILGVPQTVLHPDDERDHYWELFCHRARQAGRQTSEVLVRRADGTTVPVEITSTTLIWNDRLLVVGIFKDITERRRTEAALLAFANRMHAILSSMFDAVITADEHGVIETFNDAAERLFGWRAYEVIGRSLSVLMPPPLQDQHDAFMSNYRRGGPARNIGKERELVARRKDASLVPIELAITEILDQGEFFGSGGKSAGRRSFVGVIRDIAERKSTEAALLAAKSQAELANRAKSEFLAHMSHELRTPLNAIIGFSEILKRQLFGPLAPRYVEYAGTIYESGQHLLGIINDLLDMARIEAGRFELIEESIDVASVVESCLTMVRTRADHGELTITATTSGLTPRLCADRRSVMQVLLNLLSNSVKFTPQGGTVGVATGVAGDGQMVISVTDSGPGINADLLPRIFEPFQQADSRLSRKIEGSGLGLAISRNLMELHGGSLEIESEASRGTTARMRFPASRVLSPRG
ncbi:MAG: PAS domain S-box protein [Rhodospirillaceae bacterium]